MNARVLLTGVVIALMVSSVTFGYAFAVGSANGTGYFFGGPANTNVDGGYVGYPGNNASVGQYASAYNPGGIGFVGQCAYAVGGQSYGSQGYVAGMSQTAGKLGGSGAVTGIQSGNIQMTGGSYGGLQSSYATGTQFSMIVGGGSGFASQCTSVGTYQDQ